MSIHRGAALSLGALIMLTIASGSASAQTTYRLTDLGNISGRDVNEAGQVVGDYRTASGEQHAFLWDDGVMTDLGTLGGSQSAIGDRKSFNLAGQVTGHSTTATGERHAFLWDDGVMIDLGTLGGVESAGRGINDAGQVVGYSTTVDGEHHAFLWDDGVMTDLGTLGGGFSDAREINGVGQVIGYSTLTSGESRPFLWDIGVMRNLGTLGGTTSNLATDINEAGQVTGHSTTATGERHAFLWDDGVMTDLGTLGGTQSFGYQINESGQISGSSITATGERPLFLWSNGVMTDLGTLGGPFGNWTRFPKNTLNDAGQVTGPSRTAEGRPAAFLWDGGTMYNLNHLLDPPNLTLSEFNLREGVALNNQGQILVHGYNILASESRAYLLTPLSIPVTIDIKPGSDPNCFHINGHGIIPVAVLGSDSFDVTLIDQNTLSFGGLDVRIRGKKGPLCGLDDTNLDGFYDLVCHFEDNSDYWEPGNDDEATLTGELLDGTKIEGTDSICVVP